MPTCRAWLQYLLLHKRGRLVRDMNGMHVYIKRDVTAWMHHSGDSSYIFLKRLEVSTEYISQAATIRSCDGVSPTNI